VRRYAVLLTLLASQAVVVALSLLFHFRVRASLVAAFTDYGTPMPDFTQVALSSYLLPGSLGAAALLTAAALAAPLKRSQRHGLLGAGVVITSVALVVAVVGGFVPFFQPA
jgi:hypothetical protein